MLQWTAAIRSESKRMAGRIVGADLDAPVPSCPEWNLRDLVGHLGRVQRFWAANVRAGDPGRPDTSAGDPDQPSRGLPPDDGVAGWMRDSTSDLLSALEEAAEDRPCWTWWGDPRTCGAVARHQVQEAAVHRWDAENALGTPTPIGPGVAHDGVSEFLEIMIGTGADRLLGSLTLRSDDGQGEWIIGDQRGSHSLITAPASDLVLALYGRVPPSALRADGDPQLLGDLLDMIDTE